MGASGSAWTTAPSRRRPGASPSRRSSPRGPAGHFDAAPKSRCMRNRALHDALRNFALEAAALLTDDQKAGAEVEFDVVDEGSGRGPALYRYEPRTAAFLSERWPRLLERLYEDATSFGFPEERFERVYGEVELTLYRDAVRARVIAPLRGAWMEIDRLELGDGLLIVRGDRFQGLHERADLLCVIERD